MFFVGINPKNNKIVLRLVGIVPENNKFALSR